MEENIVEVILNPVRMRILQYLLMNENATVSEISKQLSDVPQASLYRHVKKLSNSKILVITGQNQIRGTVEKIYEISENYKKITDYSSNEEFMNNSYTFVMAILKNIKQYIESEKADIKNDKLVMSTSAMWLNDEEFREFQCEMEKIIKKTADNKPRDDRTLNIMSFITTPVLEENISDTN